jgi:hypothetical protein
MQKGEGEQSVSLWDYFVRFPPRIYILDVLINNYVDIKDVVFVSRSGFDPEKTKEIANQIGHITKELHKENRSYILIGPGRWGTATPNLGIPVTWQQIR